MTKKTLEPALRHYFKQPSLPQLRGLCEIARRGSFAGAAAALHLSAPAVWQQVRALERELGASLVQRQGHKAKLTENGLALLDIVAPLVAGFDGIEEAFLDRRHQLERRLVVATTARLLADELSGPMREFARRYPLVQLTVLDRPSTEGMALLEKQEVDLAVLSRLDEQPAHPLMEYEPLFAYPFMLASPKDHELARRPRLTLRDIVRYPLVLVSEGSQARIRIDRVLQAHGLLEKRTIALDTTNGALVLLYVELGLGVTLLPMSPTRPPRKTLHVCSVARWFGEEPVYIVRRKGGTELSHATAFRDIVRGALAGRG
jgi:molybdate transport repressor ModE-like protein